MASNSLLEGLVFAERIAGSLAHGLAVRRDPRDQDGDRRVLARGARPRIQQAMSAGAGLLRSADSLSRVLATLTEVAREPSGRPCTEGWETSNIATVAAVLAHNALLRRETRGSHWREDFPTTDDRHWRVHLTTRITDSMTRTTRDPLRSPVWEGW